MACCVLSVCVLFFKCTIKLITRSQIVWAIKQSISSCFKCGCSERTLWVSFHSSVGEKEQGGVGTKSLKVSGLL